MKKEGSSIGSSVTKVVLSLPNSRVSARISSLASLSQLTVE